MSQNQDFPTSPNKLFEKLLRRTKLLLLISVMTLLATQFIATSCSAQCSSSSNASTPVTMTNETSSLPGSYQLVNGKNTTVNTVAGQVSIDAAGGGGDVNLTQIGGNAISTGNGTTNSV